MPRSIAETGRTSGVPPGGRGRGDPVVAAGDRICHLATRLLGVPAALLTLRDAARPHLVGSWGISDDDWLSRSPLFAALSEHDGGPADVLRVDDVEGHGLLSNDPLHQELGIRAFLSVPVPGLEDGGGALSVLAEERRAWSDREVEDLAEVAAVAAVQLVLRKRLGSDMSASHATWRSFVDLVDDIDAVVNERDPETQRFLFVSRRAEEMLGYPVERWTGERGFFEKVLVHPEDRARVQAAVAAVLDDPRGADLTYRMMAADGRVVWVQDLVRPIQQEDGSTIVRGVIVEITRQKQVEEELGRKNAHMRFLQELAVRANEADSADDAMVMALKGFCELSGWPLGHAYVVESGPDGEPELAPTDLWYPDDPSVHPGFRAATSRVRFRKGDVLPGRVLGSGLPEFIPDLRDDETFVRRQAAVRAGLSSAYAFPVLAGRDVAAVLEFYSGKGREPDEATTELAAHVGTILGRSIERERGARARESAERRTRDILETANDAFVAIDASSGVTEWNAAATRLFGWRRDEVIGRPLHELIIPPEQRDAHLRGLRHFLETGEGALLGRSVEVQALRKDGSEIPVEITISPMRGERGWTFNAFLRDVTERKVGERDRNRRERLLAETQRLARIGSWDWNVATDRVSWSDELHRIFGTDPAAFQPTLETYLSRLPAEDREKAEDAIGRAMGTREPFAFEHRVERPDGSVSWILSQGRPMVDAEGEVVRMVGTAQDVTERREAESRERDLAIEQAARAEAEAAEERVRTILESISDAFVAMDGDRRLTYVNRAAEELLAQPASKLVGRELTEVFPDAAEGKLQERLDQSMDRQRPQEFEVYLPTLDAWYEVRAFPSDDGMAVYLHDITDRKRAEERLKASEARYRFLADSIPQQIWTAAPDGLLDYVNKVVVDFFGVPEDEILGDRWTARVHEDDVEEAGRRWAKSLATAEPYEMEFRLEDAEGVYRWHLARAVPQRDGDGDVVKWFGTNTYIHDQKEAEEERDRAMEELERITYLLSSERTNLESQARELRRTARALKKSNEELDRFAYITSHDLKAPLRGIANLSAWLAEDLGDKLDEETEEYIRLMQGRVHRMEALIDGILQYSRAGRSREEPDEIDVGDLVRDVVDLLDPPPHFRVEMGGWWPVIHSERTPLHQVFLNLVGNAIKHADGEDPRVRVEVSDEGEGWYEYSVIDNGPGIAPEYHEKVFTIFQTLKPRDEVESTGIGLSVVKRIVDQYGGQVWIESREGEGATFKFLWPMSPKVKEDDRWMA